MQTALASEPTSQPLPVSSPASKYLKENMGPRIQAFSKMSGLAQGFETSSASKVVPLVHRVLSNFRKSAVETTSTFASSLISPSPPSSSPAMPAIDFSALSSSDNQSLPQPVDSIVSPTPRRPTGLKRCNASINLIDMDPSKSSHDIVEIDVSAEIKKCKSVTVEKSYLQNFKGAKGFKKPKETYEPPPLISKRVRPPSLLCDESYKPTDVDLVQQRADLHRRGSFVPPRPPTKFLLRASKSIKNRQILWESTPFSDLFNGEDCVEMISLWKPSPLLRDVLNATYERHLDRLYAYAANIPTSVEADFSPSGFEEDIEEATSSPFVPYEDDDEFEKSSFGVLPSTKYNFDKDGFVILDSPSSPKLDSFPMLLDQQFDSDFDDDTDDDDDDGWLDFRATARPSSRLGVSPPSSPSRSLYRREEHDESLSDEL